MREDCIHTNKLKVGEGMEDKLVAGDEDEKNEDWSKNVFEGWGNWKINRKRKKGRGITPSIVLLHQVLLSPFLLCLIQWCRLSSILVTGEESLYAFIHDFVWALVHGELTLNPLEGRWLACMIQQTCVEMKYLYGHTCHQRLWDKQCHLLKTRSVAYYHTTIKVKTNVDECSV